MMRQGEESDAESRAAESHTLATLLVLIGLVTFGCGPESIESLQATGTASQDLESDAATPVDRFRHPLSNERASAYSVRGLDIKDSPDGLRYAVGSVSSSREGEQMVTRMGVFSLEHEPMTILERREKEPRQVPPPSRSRVAQRLRDQIVAAPEAQHTVLVRLPDPPTDNIAGEVERSVAFGIIGSTRDVVDVRERLKEQRRKEIAAAQAPIISQVESAGGKILYRCENLPCLHVSMRGGDIEAFAASSSSVLRLDPDASTTRPNIVQGMHVIDGSQITQFIDSGYDGDVTGDPEVAIIEVGGYPDTDHPGFMTDDASCCGLRILRRYFCVPSGCFQSSSDIYESAHATWVAGLLMGDLRDDQDPNYLGSTDQILRSGYAGESRMYAYGAVQDSIASLEAAFDSLYGHSSISVVNLSWATSDDPACEGETPLSRDVNDLFEAGVAVFSSAGNDGHSNTADCTVTDPSSAIGAFTVGAHGSKYNWSGFGEDEVRNGAIFTSSSRGGASYSQGKGRTIIDITAIGGRRLLFDLSGGYSNTAGGTSFAAPTVAATALDFKAFYQDRIGNFVDNPGVLYTHLLLMGDRAVEGGGYHRSQFSNLWGAGRLQARKFDDFGMDAPWERATGYTCIDDGETYYINLNAGAPIPADAGYIKAAIWWYDRRHESGAGIDDIDLRLQEDTSGSGNWVTRVTSNDRYDNKEFVFALSDSSQFDEHKARLQIKGYDVTADGEGCGTDSMRVYYAYFWEDSDRDDSDGPTVDEIDIESEH